jgi:hypothetical protein
MPVVQAPREAGQRRRLVLDDRCFVIIDVQIVVYVPKLTRRDILTGVEKDGKE